MFLLSVAVEKNLPSVIMPNDNIPSVEACSLVGYDTALTKLFLKFSQTVERTEDTWTNFS